MNNFKGNLAFTLSLFFIFTFANANLVKDLKDRNGLEIAKKHPGGVVVYFGKTKFGRAETGVELKRFFKNFEKAAKSLNDYRVNFYKVECSVDQTQLDVECGNRQGKVIVYSDTRQEEFDLSLMFDESHIVGHVLSIILEKEVEIVQDKFMWNDVLEKCKGRKDIVLLYTRGIGDTDHRYFLEAAFVYGKEYQFVVSTELSMPGFTEHGSLWLYSCKNVTGSESCTFRLKKQSPKTVLDVVRFIKQEGAQRIVEMNKDGSSLFDKQDDSFPVNKVYLFDNGLHSIKSLAEKVVNLVDSSYSFILVDVNKHQAHLEKLGIHAETVMPNLVLQPAHLLNSEQVYYEQFPADLEFNENNIVTTLDEYYKSPNNVYKSIVNLVNVEYDTIESWKKPTKGIWIVGGCMQELGECSNFKIVFRRVARSLAHSPLEFDFRTAYVDFTGSPNDAQLNTLPGFMIIKNKKIIKHVGPMDYNSIMNFLDMKLSTSVLNYPLSGSDHLPIGPSEDEDDQSDEISQMQLLKMEDDAMSRIAVDIVKKKVDDGNVLKLTDKTFNTTRDNNDLMVTLFYLPWCVKSILLRGSYAKIVEDLEKTKSGAKISTTVNKVDCFDWEDVCRNQGVFTYPVIKVYRKGLEPITYSESLDIDTIKNTIRLFQDPVVNELTDEQSFKVFTDVSNSAARSSSASASVLGLFNTKDDKELTTFTNVAKEMFGKYSFGFLAGNIAKQSAQTMKAGVPSFMIFKRNDPAESMIKSEDFENMKTFVEEHTLPVYGELTAINFPKYIAFKKPFIIHFKNSTDSSMDKTLQTFPKMMSSVFVTWMDIEKAVTREIMALYLENASELSSALVLVNHKMGKVYKYDGGNDAKELLKWTNKCLTKSISASSTFENREWKPLREGYNYLELINEQEENQNENVEQNEDEDSVTVSADEKKDKELPGKDAGSHSRDEL